ncbi:hypothetical protein [Pseudokineococcus sp. 1T1Z-3]|uniref:hypothetical protein n=1 Tax=Pseudokineococcus sp. 1T1Z-3 TaxID=3132745 RepID=UPI003096730A
MSQQNPDHLLSLQLRGTFGRRRVYHVAVRPTAVTIDQAAAEANVEATAAEHLGGDLQARNQCRRHPARHAQVAKTVP